MTREVNLSGILIFPLFSEKKKMLDRSLRNSLQMPYPGTTSKLYFPVIPVSWGLMCTCGIHWAINLKLRNL